MCGRYRASQRIITSASCTVISIIVSQTDGRRFVPGQNLNEGLITTHNNITTEHLGARSAVHTVQATAESTTLQQLYRGQPPGALLLLSSPIQP